MRAPVLCRALIVAFVSGLAMFGCRTAPVQAPAADAFLVVTLQFES